MRRYIALGILAFSAAPVPAEEVYDLLVDGRPRRRTMIAPYARSSDAAPAATSQLSTHSVNACAGFPRVHQGFIPPLSFAKKNCDVTLSCGGPSTSTYG